MPIHCAAVYRMGVAPRYSCMQECRRASPGGEISREFISTMRVARPGRALSAAGRAQFPSAGRAHLVNARIAVDMTVEAAAKAAAAGIAGGEIAVCANAAEARTAWAAAGVAAACSSGDRFRLDVLIEASPSSPDAPRAGRDRGQARRWFQGGRAAKAGLAAAAEKGVVDAWVDGTSRSSRLIGPVTWAEPLGFEDVGPASRANMISSSGSGFRQCDLQRAGDRPPALGELLRLAAPRRRAPRAEDLNGVPVAHGARSLEWSGEEADGPAPMSPASMRRRRASPRSPICSKSAGRWSACGTRRVVDASIICAGADRASFAAGVFVWTVRCEDSVSWKLPKKRGMSGDRRWRRFICRAICSGSVRHFSADVGGSYGADYRPAGSRKWLPSAICRRARC